MSLVHLVGFPLPRLIQDITPWAGTHAGEEGKEAEGNAIAGRRLLLWAQCTHGKALEVQACCVESDSEETWG